MNVLFVSPRQCWPPLTGAKLREYHLARALGKRATLMHLSFTEAGTPPMQARDLPFCAGVVSVRPAERYTASKIVRGFFGSSPLPVLNYYSREMRAALEAALETGEFDLIHLESIHMAGYLPAIQAKSKTPVVFDWHNIESEAMARYSEAARSFAHRAYASITAQRLSKCEDAMLRESFGHVVCSEREFHELKRRHSRAQIAVIENGADTRAFEEEPAVWPQRNRIVFVGSMNYRPNIDAATYFCRQVWPLLREQVPHLRFTIVGSDPVREVLDLANQTGVEVTGAVEDVRSYYREALAAVVPLRLGGGTRLKIVEAMAAGTPVVSSRLGAEGIAVEPGRNILFAETPAEWVGSVCALNNSADLWNDISSAGRVLARSRYDWDGIGERLFLTYCGWLSARVQ